MLIDVWDQVAAKLSRKWLIGRRFVIDFRDASERRIAVVELPDGSFSFDLRVVGELTELVMMSDSGPRVLASFKDPVAAERSAKRIRMAVMRPLKKMIWTAIGVLMIVFILDLVTTPSTMHAGDRKGPIVRPSVSGAAQDQMSAELRARIAQNLEMGAANTVAAPSAEPVTEAQSSPEALAAIRLLKGK